MGETKKSTLRDNPAPATEAKKRSEYYDILPHIHSRFYGKFTKEIATIQHWNS